MGWLFTDGQTRKQLIQRLTKPWTREENGVQTTTACIAHTARGNILWAVFEIQPGGERFIMCFQMQPQRGYGWGYKDVSEDMGPIYDTCPLSYLDMVPEPPNEWGRKWRERVRAYHARVNQKLTVGQTVKLKPGCNPAEVTITSLRPLKGTWGGMKFRIPRGYLVGPEEQAAHLAPAAKVDTRG